MNGRHKYKKLFECVGRNLNYFCLLIGAIMLLLVLGHVMIGGGLF